MSADSAKYDTSDVKYGSLEEYNDMHTENPSEERPSSSLKEDNEKKDEGAPPVGFFALFRYSSACDKTLIIFGTIIAIISGASTPAVMIIFGRVIDQLINFDVDTKNCTQVDPLPNCTQNFTRLRDDFLHETEMLCIWNALFGVAFLTCNYLLVSLFSVAAANQAFRIRCLFISSVLKQEIGWYDTNETGDFASKVTGNLSRIEDGIGDKVGICISYMSSTVLCVGSGIYYGWKLALVILCITPVLTIATAVMSKIQAAVSREEFAAYGSAASVAEEVLSAIRTVVAFGGERKEIERYDNCLVNARKKGIKRGITTSIGAGLTWFCIFAGYALAFWYAVKLIVQERGQEKPQYTGGTVITIFFNVMIGSMMFGQTAAYFEAFALARGAAAKIFDVIDRKPLIDSSSDLGQKPSSIYGSIKLTDVHFSYPSRSSVSVLKGVTLNVETGETIALVGPSGCGKSTIIQLILRFYDTISGSVALDGNDVRDLNVGWLRDSIGLVGQEPVLFSTTIEENIKHGKPGASREEVKKAAKLSNIHDFIESLPMKYQTLVGERGAQLSGGQKQRIAIARAIIKNPKVLLLDEATSALDTESESVVQAALDEASAGRTTIVVAHRLSTVRNADKIVVLTDGMVKEIGTHDELMKKKGVYYNLVLTQAQLHEVEEDLDEGYLDEDAENFQDSTNVHSDDSWASDDAVNKGLEKSVPPPNADRQISVASSGKRHASDQYGYVRQLSTDSFRKGSVVMEEDDDETVVPSQKRLLKVFAPEWPFAVIGGIAAMLMGLHFPAYGYLFGAIVGILQEETDEIEEKNVLYCLIFLFVAVTCLLLTFLQVFMFTVAGERLTCRLRKLAFANIITQDITFFDHPKNSVGSLCSRLTSDASDVQGATGSRISSVLQSISTLIASVTLGIYLNYKMGLLVVSFTPLMFLASFCEMTVVSGHMSREKAGTEAATKVAVEAIESIRTVASLHQEQAFYIQFRNHLLGTYKKSRLLSHVKGLMFGFANAIQSFAYAAAMYYGSLLVSNKEMPYTKLLQVLQCVLVGVSMVGQNMAFTPDYQKAKLAAGRIFKLLDLRPEIDAFSEDGLILDDVKGTIRFLKVHFSYPSRPDTKILKGLNLEIESGKTVALVGSSGCGKSTCVQLIERFYDTQAGKVMLDDLNVKEFNVANLRSHMGLVSQEPVLFSYSIAENIAYGDNTRTPEMSEIMEAARQANIHSFIASLPQGYDTPVGDKGAQLSGGQKQRVAIARALLRNPKILLLDEATSALDAESEKVVQEALDKARTGRTCLVIAHRLSTIQNADTIIVIHNGKVVEKGTHQELLNKKGHYYNLHRNQV